MEKITILLPLHKIDNDYKIMLDNAISSIKNFHNDVDLSIICPLNVKKVLEKENFDTPVKISLIENKTGNVDFTNQINIGIDSCNNKWFSILEVDDEYKNIWLSSMSDYINENNDVDIFLPVVKDINSKGDFINLMNESAWAYGFTDKQGFLDNNVLLEYQNYQTSGGLYRTEFVKSIGKFKDNIKLTFSYEFLLRAIHLGGKVMVVPRLGYVHVNFREDSLFWRYKNDENIKLNEKEIKFWLETSKKEYFFKNKRDIEYSSE